MANDQNRGDVEHDPGPHAPARDEIIDHLEAQRNDGTDESLRQPDGRDSRPVGTGGADAARRAGDGSGSSAGPSHLGEAEHAFERSRGEERRK